jgi:polysaccharide export outer membrane protein
MKDSTWRVHMKYHRKIKIWTGLVLFVFLTAFNYIGQTYASSSIPESTSQTSPYLVGPEDVLEISVWKNAELSKIVIVRPDGMISLPLIGDVKAAGLTPSQLRIAIIERLKEYQETVVVSVIVQEVNSYRIFILGEVNAPGLYLLKTRTSLLQAIALAGGFNQFASKNKIVVIRGRTNETTGMEKKVILDDIVYKDKQGIKNLILKPGDTIFVP